jgi:hypothetical protein
MSHGGSRVGTVSLSSSNSHSDCREDNGCGMVAGSGPLAPREGSRSRTEGSITRAAMSKISGLDMVVGCNQSSTRFDSNGIGQVVRPLTRIRYDIHT